MACVPRRLYVKQEKLTPPTAVDTVWNDLLRSQDSRRIQQLEMELAFVKMERNASQQLTHTLRLKNTAVSKLKKAG